MRLAVELAILPLSMWAARRPRTVLAATSLVIAAAEAGRRRGGGRWHWPRSSALWAPLWVLERGGAAWLAVGLRLRGGVPYAGARLARAATPTRRLRRRHRNVRAGGRP